MTQPNYRGIGLRPAPNARKKDYLWLIRSIVATLSSVVMALSITALAGVESWNVLLPVIAVAVILGISYGVLVKTEQESWFYLGVLTAALLFSLVCRKQLLEGFRIFWNQAGSTMVRGTGYLIPKWELQLSEKHSTVCLGLFASFGVCVISLLCSALTSFAPAVLAAAVSGSLVWGMTAFGVEAGFIWALPVLGTAVLVLMYSGWRNKNAVTPILLNWAVCAVVVAFLFAGVSIPEVQGWLAENRDSVHEALHERKYETKYTTLPEGDFSDYTAAAAKPKPALAVTMEVPQQMYLRGFTGAEFTGESWEALDRSALEKNQELLYWMNLNAFDQNAQFDAAAQLAQSPQSTVTVQNIGACSFYRYVPFSIAKGEWAQAENLNTDGVYADGERNYVYSISPATSEEITRVLSHLQTAQDSAVLQYRKAEGGYRQFISNYYLQVPQEVKDLLQEEWDEIAAVYGGAGNLTQQQAQGCTLMFLSACFPEEGTPEEVELPLDVARGTTFQYATVAAMTLRYFGIPARYAEGYVISAELAAEHESGETITVESNCAKAWVEVYQEGIGWIPMDLTPGMGQMLEQMESENPDMNNGSQKKPPKEKEKEPQEEEQPEPVGGTMVRILKAIATGFLIALLVLIALLLILWGRRKILLQRREKRWNDENCSDGVAWIYADTEVLLKKLGFDRGNGSMRSLRGPLTEKYGEEFAASFDLVTDLNDRAMFSKKAMAEEERTLAKNLHTMTLEKLKSEVKWYKQLWYQWVLCLY